MTVPLGTQERFMSLLAVTGNWSQEAYIKASNTGAFDFFGNSVSLSDDGNTLAVGANQEDSNSTGVNRAQGNDLSLGDRFNAGAAYVFTRSAGNWSQEAYIKTTSPNDSDYFGTSVSISGDGDTLGGRC